MRQLLFQIEPTHNRNVICMAAIIGRGCRRLRRVSAISLLALTFFCNPITAQTPEFVPAGISMAGIERTQTTQNGFHKSGSASTPALDVYRDRDRIDDDAVSGNIRHETAVYRISYQYGITNGFNLGITVPYLTQQRHAQLNVHDNSALRFAETYQDTETSGMGDFEISGWSRLFYNDSADLQLGLALTNDNGAYHADDPEKTALGSGGNELTLAVRSHLFSIHSTLMLAIEIEYVLSEKNEVTSTGGQKVSRAKENSSKGRFDLSYNQGRFAYGGGLRMASIGETSLDDVPQKDGYLLYSLRGFVTVGNLNLLEKGVVKHPWELRLLAEKSVSGSNAPASEALSVRLMTFF